MVKLYLRYHMNKLMHHGVYLRPVDLCIRKELKKAKKGTKSWENREEMTTAFKKAVRKCYAIQKKKRLKNKRK